MTAKESISNKLFSMKYFRHTVRSYWWLGVIASIIYAIAGPLILWMSAANTKNRSIMWDDYATTMSEMSGMVKEWFVLNGVISYYVIAMFLAVIFALVTWSYLHSKKQINFYHSMPVSREALFLNNVLLGIAINIGPMLVMYAISVLIGIGYGGVEAIPWKVALIHPVRIFLYFMLSYSLAVLAAQLTGTVLTQFGMSAVLHFGLMSFLLVAVLAMQTFLNTFNSGAAFDRIWGLSPLTNFFYWCSDYMYIYDNQNALQGLGWKWITEIIIITILAFAAAFWAYKKRASESAGVPLIYGFTKPMVEFLLMFCVASLAGTAFLEVSGKFFFVIGLILFAVLTHMFCQVVYSKDFKAMFANKKYLLAFVAALLLFFGGMYADLFGYDRYVPKSDKISAIQINLNALESRNGNYYAADNQNAYTDANDIELLLAIADQVTKSGHYYHNSSLHSNEYLTDIAYRDTINLRYTYITSSGRKINREYLQVPISEFKQDFLALYNQNSFKKNNYAWLFGLKTDDIYGYSVINILYQELLFNSGAVSEEKNMSYYYSSGYGFDNGMMDNRYTAELLNALKLDIVQRDSSDFTLMPLYVIETQIADGSQNDRSSSRSYQVAVYSCDSNALAVIDKIAADNALAKVDYNYLASAVGSLEIYESDNDINNFVSDLLGVYYSKDDISYLSENGFKKTRTVTDKAEIADILAHTLGRECYGYTSSLMNIRNDIFVAVHLKNVVDSNVLWDLNMAVPEGTDI